MNTFLLEETSLWGDTYKATTPEEVLRCGEKRQLLQTSYPFLDHYRIYGVRPRGQRGPLRESQTCIVSYVYIYDEFIGTRETEFIQTLASIQLRFHKEPCLFRGKNAYAILILDTEVDVTTVLRMIQVPS
jgi:hypothetical protein